MIRILHSVSNMDRAGIETMLMNYYRYMDKSKVQFDFLCNKKKPGAYDDEIKSMGGRIYHTPGLNPAKYPVYLKYMRELFQEHKKNYPVETGKIMREKYENGLIRNEHEFKEVLNNVLFGSKRS